MVKVKRNKAKKIVLSLSYSAMEDLCQALSYMVEQYVIIADERSIVKIHRSNDMLVLLYESIFLDLYNRLRKADDSPLNDLHSINAKYSVKLSRTEALAFWGAVNPINIIQDGRPGLRMILDGLYKELL